MEKYSFDIKHTNIAKGFFVLAMVLHHVFADEMEWYITNLTGGEASYLLTHMSYYGKVCVGGFIFLSVYGITRKLMTDERLSENPKMMFVTRIVKLYFAYWPIFAVGVMGTLLWGNIPFTEIYKNPWTGEFSLIQVVVDMLGLADLFGTPTLNVTWWYMTVALFVIFATPIYDRFYCRFKGAFVVVMIILSMVAPTRLYLSIPALAVAFAREDALTKAKEIRGDKLWKHILQWAIAIGLLYISFVLFDSMPGITIALPFQTVACQYFCFVVLGDIPVLREILAFLGKHSANIFFVHTFLYYYWFTWSIYNLGNKWLVYGAVVLGALLISVAVELLKKVVKYQRLEQGVITYLLKPTYKSNP